MNMSCYDADLMQQMGVIAHALKTSSAILAEASSKQKDTALLAMAKYIRLEATQILNANQLDLEAAEEKNLKPSFVDRLTLNEARIEAMAKGIEDIAALPDPTRSIIAQWERPNGLEIKRVRTPIGVIGVIYESRPNVTADAGALCLKAGNAVLLRGGSEGVNSNRAIHKAMQKGLEEAKLPVDAISLVPTTNRDAVGMMLQGLEGAIDVIIPRGGKNLVARVQSEARVPVFAHLEGLCHLYIDKAANLEMARDIVLNSKMRRTGICGSVETLLVHQDIVHTHLNTILDTLSAAGCEIRGSEEVCAHYSKAKRASEEDWRTEYLDAIISVKIVENLEAATQHIAFYGSEHTDGIISDDEEAAKEFFAKVNSAIVLHNASTQFADGGEFGMGAEIGIATGKMHARGPIGVEQLTSFHYQVSGNGQIRPV